MIEETIPLSVEFKKDYIIKKVLIFLLLSTIIGSIGVGIALNKHYKNTIAAIQVQADKELGTCKVYTIREHRLECMIITVMTAYKLSKWEAFYLCCMCDDFSMRYKVPWEVFVAIIRVESNFNPSAKSPAGCKGYMQLKESTAREIAVKLGIRYGESTLWNDILNVVLGSTYLCTHINEKGLKGGIKSYLGGPDYKKSVKNNHSTRNYVREYKTSVMLEYEKLALMFRGVVSQKGYDYDIIYTIPQETDPIPLVFTLFSDTTVVLN